MILKLLLSTQMIWMIFIKKKLKNIIEIKDDCIRLITILIVFEDIIADMLCNKKLNPTVTALFIGGKKLNISFVFITQSYFAVPKNIRLNAIHYFAMKIPNIREIQLMAFNHSSDIDFQVFMNLYKNYAAKPYSFLVIYTTHASDNS